MHIPRDPFTEGMQEFFPEFNVDADLLGIADKTPVEAQLFYEDFGFMEHQETREPVRKLSEYQRNIWNQGYKYKYRLTVKSQKVGISTTTLMEDFQRALLPLDNKWSCRGKEILIIAQSIKHANEHLRTLRTMIMNSNKYKRFLVTKMSEVVLKDEITKVSVMYIKNPSNPRKPTRIIALGPKESGIWSWKEVKHIHMSDVAAINAIDDSGSFGAAMSRLANTRGSIHIETPPRGQRGKIWELFKSFAPGNTAQTEAQKAAAFHVEMIKAYQAVEAGIISQEFLDGERERNPVLYSQLYECEFMNPYASWYEEHMIKYAKERGDVTDYVD